MNIEEQRILLLENIVNKVRTDTGITAIDLALNQKLAKEIVRLTLEDKSYEFLKELQLQQGLTSIDTTLIYILSTECNHVQYNNLVEYTFIGTKFKVKDRQTIIRLLTSELTRVSKIEEGKLIIEEHYTDGKRIQIANLILVPKILKHK